MVAWVLRALREVAASRVLFVKCYGITVWQNVTDRLFSSRKILFLTILLDIWQQLESEIEKLHTDDGGRIWDDVTLPIRYKLPTKNIYSWTCSHRDSTPSAGAFILRISCICKPQWVGKSGIRNSDHTSIEVNHETHPFCGRTKNAAIFILYKIEMWDRYQLTAHDV